LLSTITLVLAPIFIQWLYYSVYYFIFFRN
jgi:hypothetical protein